MKTLEQSFKEFQIKFEEEKTKRQKEELDEIKKTALVYEIPEEVLFKYYLKSYGSNISLETITTQYGNSITFEKRIMDEAMFYFLSINKKGVINIISCEYLDNTFKIWYTVKPIEEQPKKKKNFFGF